ncbi:unnamed protein product [Schistosoma margrebowiei]|uniref:ENTH domain-containing protein n=1 Tax=Schistosoma margrebowiei TaxID=48269 RepID=A0A3P8HFB1_9TREM|nr:unnamed protein product [Schistosoma margrebowiei]
MLSAILKKIKSRKLTNIMMNYTEAEMKVREATNDDMCCPSGRLLQKLADYTYTYETCLEVMSTLWKRMHPEDRLSWRKVYKSLVVLTFLLKNGSDYVLQSAQDHIYDIRTLESFRYFDENGKDQGMNGKRLFSLIQKAVERRKEIQSHGSRILEPMCTMVWNQGFPTPLGGPYVSTNPVKAPEFRLLFTKLRELKANVRRSNRVGGHVGST